MISIIRQSKGKFFGVDFIKKDGTLRKMCARLGVRKGVKGVVNRAPEDKKHGVLTVWDVNKKDFRRINLNTIKRLKVNGIEYV